MLNDQKKELEADFHSANYNVLSDLVVRLRTAAGYLSLVRGQLGMVYTDGVAVHMVVRIYSS